MKEWFYYRVDLKKQLGMKDTIMRSMRTSFSLNTTLQRTDATQTTMIVFNIVSSYMHTRDIVYEHNAYRLFLVKDFFFR
jgi:hypothetical protein